MKANQVCGFFRGFKFSKNYLLMDYKLNKILNQTSKSKADLSHTNSWGLKLYSTWKVVANEKQGGRKGGKS
jgi:hypothetical protein